MENEKKIFYWKFKKLKLISLKKINFKMNLNYLNIVISMKMNLLNWLNLYF
jgi:hypothetical protein